MNLLNDSLQEQQETVKISLQAHPSYQLTDLSSLDLVLRDDETLNNTSLDLDQSKAQAIPSLSQTMLYLLSAGLALLALTHRRMPKGFKLGAKL
ncbi:MAG: hypothetical protein E6Q83_11410 [Thiothrix sp.]|nr:MAG: hypothetical protein E6Q83_11410 [Thiothrix sp.]